MEKEETRDSYDEECGAIYEKEFNEEEDAYCGGEDI
jgi:hypothetical protein